MSKELTLVKHLILHETLMLSKFESGLFLLMNPASLTCYFCVFLRDPTTSIDPWIMLCFWGNKFGIIVNHKSNLGFLFSIHMIFFS